MTDLDLLRMEHISKAFPGVQALDDVSLNVGAGEILGLIGENGAGKSTLMKIVSGVYPADQGQVFLRGQPVQVQNPHHAQQLGLAIIYQEFNLMPNLTVMENIFVGREPGRFAFVRPPPVSRNRPRSCSTGSACACRPLPSCAIWRWPNSRWSRSPRRSP